MTETQEKTVYPEWMDRYFKENEIIIKRLPDNYRIIDKQALPNKTIKTTKQFVQYLETEQKFWNYEKVSNNVIVSNYSSTISTSLSNINTLRNSDETEGNKRLFRDAVNNFVNTCQIASITNIAKWFKNFSDRNQYFFYGFKDAITNSSPSYSGYAQWHEGFYYGMEYKNAIQSIEILVSNYGLSYKEALEKAEKELNELVENSSNLFYSQQEEILEVKTNTLKEIAEQKKQFLEYKTQKEQELTDLENLYQEKLKLSKPAEYWKKMSKSYTRSGGIWLGVSALLAVAIISGLALLIIYTPNLFEKNAYWLDIVKDTALLTVITSVAIYVLRITIKLSLSSFHLSRDAREREQLSYFYLSLMESKGITEKERALIINSLFSRSDTGLLKGDASPSMTANISDLLEKDKSK